MRMSSNVKTTKLVDVESASNSQHVAETCISLPTASLADLRSHSSHGRRIAMSRSTAADQTTMSGTCHIDSMAHRLQSQGLRKAA